MSSISTNPRETGGREDAADRESWCVLNCPRHLDSHQQKFKEGVGVEDELHS